MSEGRVMTGAYSDTAPATPEIQEIADIVRESFYKQLSSVGYQFPEYRAISFRQQVVAGMNYLIKVCVNGEWCVHMLVFRELGPGLPVALVTYEEGATMQTPLDPPA